MDQILEYAAHLPRGKWRWLALFFCAALLVNGCNSFIKKTPKPSQPAAQPEQKLPDVVLTPDLFYDILVGEIARQRGDYGVSLDALMRSAKETRDPRLIKRAAQVAMYSHHTAQALEAAHLWVEVAPDNVLAQEVLGATLISAGDSAAAEQHLKTALGLYGDDLDSGYQRMAEVLGRTGNGAAALKVMQELVALHPKFPQAYFYLAHTAAQLQAPDQALAAINRALVLRPDWEDAAILKVQLLVGAHKANLIPAFVDGYLRDHESVKRLRLVYARYLLDTHQNDKAREQFTAVVNLDPDDADANYAVGLLSIQASRYKDAVHYLKRTLDLNPSNDQARLYLGEVAMEQKQYGDAANWFHQIKDQTLVFEARLREAMALAGEGDTKGALRLLDSIRTTSDKEFVHVALTKEQILRDAKQLDAAMTVMNAAIAKLPDETDLLYARALLAAQMHNVPLHEHDIRTLLAKDPKNAHALNALGYTLANQTHRYGEALELIKKALALRPNDPYILDSMGWVQYRLGHNQEALGYLRRAMKGMPDAEIAAHLGEVLWVSGDRKAARNAWRQGLKLSPDNEALHKTMKRFGQ